MNENQILNFESGVFQRLYTKSLEANENYYYNYIKKFKERTDGNYEVFALEKENIFSAFENTYSEGHWIMVINYMLNGFYDSLYALGLWEEGAKYSELALKASIEIKNNSYIIYFYCQTAFFLFKLGEYEKAKEYYSKSLKVKRETPQSKTDRACTYNNLGDIATIQENYFAAKNYYTQSLKINSEDKVTLSNSYKGLGMVALKQGDYDEAKIYTEKELKLKEELGDKFEIAAAYNNLGIITSSRRNYEDTKKYFILGLKIFEELGDSSSVATAYNNLAQIAMEEGNYTDAKKYNIQCLEIVKKLGNKFAIALSYSSLGTLAFNLGDYAEAKELLIQALKIHQEMQDVVHITQCLYDLAFVIMEEDETEGAVMFYESYLLAKQLSLPLQYNIKVNLLELFSKEDLEYLVENNFTPEELKRSIKFKED